MAILGNANIVPVVIVRGGVPGPPIVGDFILMEGTGFVLMEDNSKIKLE
tara:strand:- start:583 stop:729 length:147 start_codon:yes stop_codon:yes gene_type:complete